MAFYFLKLVHLITHWLISFSPLWVQLLNHHVVTELMLIDVLMNNMMERISDPSCAVRMLAVRGLGNIAVGSPEKVGIPPVPSVDIFSKPFGIFSIFSSSAYFFLQPGE